MARNKFVSKLESKITKLNKALRLLTKIDHLLFINQSGGSIIQKMGVSIADLEARGVAWKAALTSTSGLQAKLSELETDLNNYQSKIDHVLGTLGANPTINLAGFDKFKMLDSTVYNAAKTAVEAALLLHQPGKNNSTNKNALDAAVAAFNKEVDDSTNIVDSDKQAVKDLLVAKTDAIKGAAPP